MNSGGLKEIDVAATLGIVGGHAEKELAVLEGVVKYGYVCRGWQGSAVKLKTYCIWWSGPAAVIAGGCLLHLQHSALAMLLAAGGTFAFGLVCELRPGGCLHGYWEGLKKKFEKT